jgi:uncharacterized membrane protein
VPAIEFVGALAVTAYCLKAVVALVRGRGVRDARLMVAEGALWGLSFKVAATILKLTTLNTWHQIGMAAATILIRTALKQLFTWEAAQLRAKRPASDQAA